MGGVAEETSPSDVKPDGGSLPTTCMPRVLARIELQRLALFRQPAFANRTKINPTLGKAKPPSGVDYSEKLDETSPIYNRRFKMGLEFIYLTRHGFRSNWEIDALTGTYSTSIPSPTNIPSDPALTGHGVQQSYELASKLASLEPPIECFYSSPFYRCLQTLTPTLKLLQEQKSQTREGERGKRAILKIRADPGLGEWHGLAHFSHPSPAPLSLLSTLFPSLLDTAHAPTIAPPPQGESVAALHDRVAYSLHRIIEECDREGIKAIAVCTHAATLLAACRALTGRMPADIGEEDFSAYTCGLSVFQRRKKDSREVVQTWEGLGSRIPAVRWRDGRGVTGGWDCAVNGDCSFLSRGEERGWRFNGDESFLEFDGPSQALDARAEPSLVVEARKEGEEKPLAPLSLLPSPSSKEARL